MKEVFNHQDPARVGYYKTILEEAGIVCFIRNQFADGSAFGSVALPQFNPALCVMKDADYANARLLLNAHEFPEKLEGADWVCPRCGEEVPGELDTCWNCQADQPAKS